VPLLRLFADLHETGPATHAPGLRGRSPSRLGDDWGPCLASFDPKAAEGAGMAFEPGPLGGWAGPGLRACPSRLACPWRLAPKGGLCKLDLDGKRAGLRFRRALAAWKDVLSGFRGGVI